MMLERVPTANRKCEPAASNRGRGQTSRRRTDGENWAIGSMPYGLHSLSPAPLADDSRRIRKNIFCEQPWLRLGRWQVVAMVECWCFPIRVVLLNVVL
jgi:hypothetical protein